MHILHGATKISNLCFAFGRNTKKNEDESHQTIFLIIRNDSKSKYLDQHLKNLPNFSHIDQSFEGNNLIILYYLLVMNLLRKCAKNTQLEYNR